MKNGLNFQKANHNAVSVDSNFRILFFTNTFTQENVGPKNRSLLPPR